MKKQMPKTEDANRATGTPADAEPSDPKASDAKPINPTNAGLPTVEQLAMIAATLANSKYIPKFTIFDQSVLTFAAMKLWLSARETIFFAVHNNDLGRQEMDWQNYISANEIYFRPTDQYPVSRDEFLKKMLPHYKSRPRELERIFKDHLTHQLLINNVVKNIIKPPTQDEIDVAYAEFGPIQTHGVASALALRFKIWYDHHVSEVRHAAGKVSEAVRKQSKKARAKQSK